MFVRDAHFSKRLRAIHDAVLDIVAVINRPELDDVLLKEADVRLERALFPLIVLIGRFGPIGVVDLAGRVGRDHSTVSRQIGQLTAMGLVTRRKNRTDGRSREAVVTAEGAAMNEHIDVARERLGRRALADWSASDLDHLATLMQRYAAALKNPVPDQAHRDQK